MGSPGPVCTGNPGATLRGRTPTNLDRGSVAQGHVALEKGLLRDLDVESSSPQETTKIPPMNSVKVSVVFVLKFIVCRNYRNKESFTVIYGEIIPDKGHSASILVIRAK